MLIFSGFAHIPSIIFHNLINSRFCGLLKISKGSVHNLSKWKWENLTSFLCHKPTLCQCFIYAHNLTCILCWIYWNTRTLVYLKSMNKGWIRSSSTTCVCTILSVKSCLSPPQLTDSLSHSFSLRTECVAKSFSNCFIFLFFLHMFGFFFPNSTSFQCILTSKFPFTIE